MKIAEKKYLAKRIAESEYNLNILRQHPEDSNARFLADREQELLTKKLTNLCAHPDAEEFLGEARGTFHCFVPGKMLYRNLN